MAPAGAVPRMHQRLETITQSAQRLVVQLGRRTSSQTRGDREHVGIVAGQAVRFQHATDVLQKVGVVDRRGQVQVRPHQLDNGLGHASPSLLQPKETVDVLVEVKVRLVARARAGHVPQLLPSILSSLRLRSCYALGIERFSASRSRRGRRSRSECR